MTGNDSLTVKLDEVEVGELESSNEGSAFRLSEAYLNMSDRPVLGQVFEDNPKGDYVVRQGVPPWFANLLPEGPLLRLIAEKAGVHESRARFLLALLGQDLPGAVQVEGAVTDWADEGAPTVDVEDEPDVLKFSLAGVQLKFSVNLDGRGLTVPASGVGGDWIVKLPDQRYELVPEMEHLGMTWAAATGIDVPEVMLIPVDQVVGLPPEVSSVGGQAFAVRRFDRAAAGRVHIEDFAQVLNVFPRQKYEAANYETLARVLSALSGPDDVDELVRRLVFLVAIGNGDAHLKNWSLIYPDRVHARLSPAYDLVPTVAFIPTDRLGLNLNGEKAFDAVSRDSFRRLAERSGVDVDRVLRVVDEQVERTAAAWEAIRAEAQLPDAYLSTLDRRLVELPLFSGLVTGSR